MNKIAKGIKTLKDIIDSGADEETVKKVLRAMKGESADAVPKLGSGKNLKALQSASDDIADSARKVEAPAYPKNNVGGKEIPKKDFELVGEPQSKDFTMVPEGSQVPAVRGNTLPKAPEVVEAEMMPLALRNNNLPSIDANIADPKKSNMLRNLMAGSTVGLGLGGAMLMGGDEQQAAAQAQIPMQRPPEPKAPVAPPVQPEVKAPVLPSVKPAVAKSPLAEVAPQVENTPSEVDYLQQLLAAQENQGSQNLVDNMLRAGTTIGSAIAGNKADYSQIDALQKQNGIGIQNVKDKMTADMDTKKLKAAQGELDDDTKLRDPNSDMSKTLRDMLSKLGYPVNEKVSGKQLKDMGINVYNLLSQKEAREQGRLNREATMGNANTERTKVAVDRGMQNLRKGKEYVAYTNTKDAMAAFDYALASKDKEAVGTAFMKFAKSAQGDDSVVRSEDMKTLAGGTPFGNPKKMLDHYIALSQGKNFTDTELKNMKKIMEAALKIKGSAVYKQSSPLMKKMESAQLNVEEFVDPSEVEEFSKYAPANEGGSSSYSPQEEAAISMVMQKNGVDKNTAINALKKAGKIK